MLNVDQIFKIKFKDLKYKLVTYDIKDYNILKTIYVNKCIKMHKKIAL